MTSPAATETDALERLRTMVRVYATHLQDAHAHESDPPMLATDTGFYELRCAGCGWTWGIEGEESSDEVPS